MPSIKSVSAGDSVATSTGTIENDGVASASCTLQVLDTDGNPLSGADASACVLAVSGTGNTPTQPTGVANAEGYITGSFVSTVAESKTVSWTVRSTAITDTSTTVVSGVAVEFPNLPSGYTELRDITPDVNYPTSANTSADDFTYQSGDFRRYATGRSIGVLETSPDGSYVIRNRFNSGMAAGYALQMDPGASPANTRKFYTSFTFKMNTDFEGESGGGYKMFYPLFSTNGATATNSSLSLNLRSYPTASTSSGEFKLQALQMQRYTGGAYYDYPLNQNANDTVYVPDTWYRVEVQCELETVNQGDAVPADGVLKVWTSEWNGTSWDASVLRINYTDVRYGSNATVSRVMGDLMYQFYRGGSGAPVLSNDSDISIGRAYWATEV